jgi:hypothetical protein
MKVGDRVRTTDGREGVITGRGLERFSRDTAPIWLVELNQENPPDTDAAYYEDRLICLTNPMVDLIAFKERLGSKIPS